MLLVVATFIGVLAIVLGAYYFLVARGEGKVLERLKPRTARRSGLVRSFVSAERHLSSVGSIQAGLARTEAADRVRTVLEQAGLTLTVSSLLLLMGCAGLAVFIVVARLTGFMVAGFLAGAVAAWLPYRYVTWVRDKRLMAFEAVFPEAIDLVARALRAGHALPTGIGMVADELPPPVGAEFRKLYDEQNYGLTQADAMRNFARRVPLIDARLFVTAVLTQRESGGNLSEVLDNLSAVIRERFRVKRQIRVISAHGRITGWVLVLLPPSIAVAMMTVNPGYLATLTGDPLGRQMILGGIVLQIIGTLVIRKIVSVEY